MLGNGTSNRASDGYSRVPVMVTGLTNATMLASDDDGYCALVGSGDAACWGDNSDGQLGSGSSVEYSNLPVAVAGLAGAAAIVGGSLGFCAVSKNGGVRCWGYAASGQLGNGVTAGNAASSSVPVAVRGLGR